MSAATNGPGELREESGHVLTVAERSRMVISGVEHVDSFNDEAIVLVTEGGHLAVTGQDLTIEQLDLDEGTFRVRGRIDGLQYSEEGAAAQQAGGFLRRLFR